MHERRDGREPIFDLNGIMLEPPHPGPYGGVPMGGIGSGCIGKSFLGDMRRWSLHPGKYSHAAVYANQFSIRVKRDAVIHSKVLSINIPESVEDCLRSWNWGVEPEKVEYSALFPRSWTVFREPVPGVDVIIRQISPVVPHRYSETSLPTCCFVVEVINLDDSKEIEVSVMFTVRNSDGNPDEPDDGYAHARFLRKGSISTESNLKSVSGICMTRHTSAARTSQTQEGTLAIAAAIQNNDDGLISFCEQFHICENSRTSRIQRFTANDLWESFSTHGLLEPQGDVVSEPGFAVGAAVCVKKGIINSKTFEFSMAWDFPFAYFGDGRKLPKYYTRFMGQSGNSAHRVAAFSLNNFERWEKAIFDWQKPILSNEEYPEYYRHMLFNELYYVVDGGTIWLDSTNGVPNRITSSSDTEGALNADTRLKRLRTSINNFESTVESVASEMLQNDLIVHTCEGNSEIVGQFLYLEGHEYLMYNTYDVHFYAGFAILQLWPQLELSIQRDFAVAVNVEDGTLRVMLGEGVKRQRKVSGCIPHDLGSPSEDPFFRPNVYNFQDVSLWKDLPSKFVLQVYRNVRYLNSFVFLRDVYDVVVRVMNHALQFDKDGDGMIENEGFPDQTYDIWTATGVHSYCGGLWVSACFATAAMAKLMDDIPNFVRFTEIGDRARTVFQKQLWNGVYFDYDNSLSSHHDSIMADMLAGQWYCRLCGLPPIATAAQAFSCYRTIYKFNVETFGNGEMVGAVNGMRPTGHVDDSCLQSREVWTGVTYALAAAMLHEASVLKEVAQRATDKEASGGSATADSLNYVSTALHGIDADIDFVFDETLNIGFGIADKPKMRNLLWPTSVKGSVGSGLLESVRSSEIPLMLSSNNGCMIAAKELRDMAFSTAFGIYEGGWNKFGYWFATPEGWERSGNYRSLGYMRPLSIWAIHFSQDGK